MCSIKILWSLSDNSESTPEFGFQKQLEPSMTLRSCYFCGSLQPKQDMLVCDIHPEYKEEVACRLCHDTLVKMIEEGENV